MMTFPGVMSVVGNANTGSYALMTVSWLFAAMAKAVKILVGLTVDELLME
jgi:hypothetical protein